MTQTDEAFRTDDMTLATVLALHGFAYQTEKFDAFVERTSQKRKKVIWVFSCEDDGQLARLNTVVEQFSRRRISVEPRALITRLSQIREEMYREIGVPNRRFGASREASSAQQ